MSYDEDAEKDRVELMLRLTQTDIEARLVRAILEDLTPSERQKLAQLAAKHVEGRFDKLLNSSTDVLVKGWIEQEVRTLAAARWQEFMHTARARVDARIGALLTDGDSLNTLITNHVNPVLRKVVADYVQTLRWAAKP